MGVDTTTGDARIATTHPARGGALVPLVRQFIARAASAPDALALVVYPAGSHGATARITWGEWAAASRAIAAQLLRSGVERGDRIAVLSDNRPLWPIADLAMQMVGAVGVGVYPTSAVRQVERLMVDSGATVALVAGASHQHTMREVRRRLSGAFPIVADVVPDEPLVEAGPGDDSAVVTTASGFAPGDATWAEWLRAGTAALHTHAELATRLDGRIRAIALDDLAAIIYTSGSTGLPKGACISHRYLAESAVSITEVLTLTGDDRAVSFLPYSHAAERVFGQCTRIVTGMSAALIEDPTDLFAVARHFEPTVLGGLPRIFERLYEAAEVARREGSNPRDAIVQRIGTRCRVATSGGAAMPVHIARELAQLGLPIVGAYGQTEHLCVAMNRPGHVRFDTVGLPMPGTTVRIADDGELQVARTAMTFTGYWGDPDATRAAFTADGAWLRTGDRAVRDADGMLRITGRVKELIALSTGRKIAPLPIESALVSTSFIAHAVCYGEGRKYLTVLITLRRAVVEAWARGEGVRLEWPALVQHPRVHALLQDAVSQVNADLARTDRIQRFAVIEHEFTLERGELTPTEKVVRRVIEERYAKTLDALYDQPTA